MRDEGLDEMSSEKWRRELIVAVLSFGFGFFILPVLIYAVGKEAVGDYAPDAGLLDLAEHIWSDFFNLKPAAWLLVLSPYCLLLLGRLLGPIRRRFVDVKPITDSRRQ